MASRTCLPLYPNTVYGAPVIAQRITYPRKPCSSVAEWSGPVRVPPRKQAVRIPKYRPYSWTRTSAATFDAPNRLCMQRSMDMSSRIPFA